MKKIITSFLLATGLVLSANAAYFGASTGYLVDSEEMYYTVRGGSTLKATSSMIHSMEVELGYTKQDENSVKSKIYPLTLNYRAEFLTSGSVTPYAGVGAGAARVELEGFGFSDHDNTFAAQAFAGVGFKVTDSMSLNVGARYIWLDDVKLFGTDAKVGDDVSLEAGISFRF